jgi:hypothetical protein
MTNRKQVYEEYMRRVDQIAEECDWVTSIGPETLVGIVISILEEKTIDMVRAAYNAGYLDANCNHINDVDTYINDITYLNDN